MGLIFSIFTLPNFHRPISISVTSRKNKSTGTVYTPAPIAEHMVALALSHLKLPSNDTPLEIMDPAVGEGIFPLALRKKLPANTPHRLFGCDIDPKAIQVTQSFGPELHLFHDSFFNLPNHLPEAAFDLIIGNPPYLKEYTQRSAFEHLPYYQGKMDLWYAFACQAFDWLKPGGILCFIATNNWTTNQGASILRDKLAREMRILKLIDFGACQVFSNASVQTMILLLQKDASAASYPFEYHRFPDESGELREALDFLKSLTPADAQRTFHRERFANTPFRFPPPQAEKLLDKIAARQNFSLLPSEIAQGIVPNPDVLNTRNLKKIPDSKRKKHDLAPGQGVFVLRPHELPPLSPNEAHLLKPVYEAALTSRYYLPEQPSRQLLYLTPHTAPCLPGSLRPHLEKFREIMEDRRETRKGRIEWFHLHWPRKEDFFQPGPKLLSVRKCKRPTFLYTEQPAYVMLSFNVIKSDRINLRYLCGLLNSSLMETWLQHRGKMQGNQFQVDRDPLLELPIYVPEDAASVHRVVELVERIREARGQGAESETLEKELDEVVWGLYGFPNPPQ